VLRFHTRALETVYSLLDKEHTFRPAL